MAGKSKTKTKTKSSRNKAVAAKVAKKARPGGKKPVVKAAAKKRSKRKATPKKPLIGLDPFAELAAVPPPSAKPSLSMSNTAGSGAGNEPRKPEAIAVAPPLEHTEADFDHIEMPAMPEAKPLPGDQSSGKVTGAAPQAAPKAPDRATNSGSAESATKALDDMSKANPDVFVLPEALVLQNAAEIYPDFVQALDREGDLQVDAANVLRVDTAGMQLLLAMTQSARQRGRKVRIQGAGELLAEKARILGFSDELNL